MHLKKKTDCQRLGLEAYLKNWMQSLTSLRKIQKNLVHVSKGDSNSDKVKSTGRTEF